MYSKSYDDVAGSIYLSTVARPLSPRGSPSDDNQYQSLCILPRWRYANCE